MFYVTRYWYKYGREGDPVETTSKEYETIEKALAYAQRYATGIRFVLMQIEDEDLNLIYEYSADGKLFVDRTKEYMTKDKQEKKEIKRESKVKEKKAKAIKELIGILDEEYEATEEEQELKKEEEPAEKQEETTESQEELKTIETDEQIEQNYKNKLYEFYLEGGILIHCNECRKSKNNFLHLYNDDINVAAIDLSIFSVSFLCKSKSNTITFELERIENPHLCGRKE